MPRKSDIGHHPAQRFCYPVSTNLRRELRPVRCIGESRPVDRDHRRGEGRHLPQTGTWAHIHTHLGWQKALRDKNGLVFCAGHWQVKEVTNFTEPGKAIDGATRSTVQFTYVAVDVPKWTTSAIGAGFPNLKHTIDTPGKGRADLVLTNNGWEAHIDTFSND